MCPAEALKFISRCSPSDRNWLLNLFHELGEDPFRLGDIRERDQSGRDTELIVMGRFAVLYWADHAVKELKIVDVRYADK